MPKTIDQQVNEKLLAMLTLVDPKAIVSTDSKRGILYIGGERVDEGRLRNLKAEADFLLGSDIWKLLYETPKELAQRSMFVLGEDLEGLRKGRSMLFTLDTQQKIVDTFAAYQPKPQ